MNIIVTREDNKDAQNVKEFMQSYQSPEVAKAAETIFNGGAVLAGKPTHREARMVRQRQADLLLIAATVIAACGWIFSREAIAGMPVFAFLGCVFLRRAASAAVLPRFSPAKAALAKTHHQRTLVCAQPLPVDLFGLHDGVSAKGRLS